MTPMPLEPLKLPGPLAGIALGGTWTADRPPAPRSPHAPERHPLGRAHASWRDMPLEFGKWETAYKRYRLWRDLGLWQRLLALLGDTPIDESTEMTLEDALSA